VNSIDSYADSVEAQTGLNLKEIGPKWKKELLTREYCCEYVDIIASTIIYLDAEMA
jgi:hypothetical protein